MANRRMSESAKRTAGGGWLLIRFDVFPRFSVAFLLWEVP